MKENIKKRHRIKIDGQEYTIAGPGSAEHVEAAVQLVNEQIDYLKEVNPQLTPLQRANLVAFNAVADEVAKQKELEQLKQSLPKNSTE